MRILFFMYLVCICKEITNMLHAGFYIFHFRKEEGVIRTMEAPKVSYPIFDKVLLPLQ